MWLRLLLLVSLVLSPRLLGEVLHFDFAQTPAGQVPAGFKSLLSGEGPPGDWQVVYADQASPAAPPAAGTRVTEQQAVVAQLSRDRTDERFPMLVYQPLTVADFTFTARVKLVEGAVEQMAGLVFRVQDEKNYYIARVSALGNNIRFYKMVGGVRTSPIGPELPIPKGTWIELSVQCAANQIRVFLNGQQAIPTLTDDSFTEGKVGFWTKSDSVSWFTEARLDYVPMVAPAQQLVDIMMREHSRILGIKIYAATAARPKPHVIASNDPSDLGQPATTVEEDVIARGMPYFGKEKSENLVTLPLRDRNGDPMAAVKFKLERFAGQTDQNAVARALPLIKEMQTRAKTISDLTR
jgi:hypothetical protein